MLQDSIFEDNGLEFIRSPEYLAQWLLASFKKSVKMENIIKTVPVLYSHSLSIDSGIAFNIAQHNMPLNINEN